MPILNKLDVEMNESDQILMIIIGLQVLFLKFFAAQFLSLLRRDIFLIYGLGFLICIAILGFFLFKKGRKILVLLMAISLSMTLPTVLIWIGKKDTFKKEQYVVSKKEFVNLISYHSNDAYNVFMNKVGESKSEIILKHEYGLYHSCSVGDTIELDLQENIFYGLETYSNVVLFE